MAQHKVPQDVEAEDKLLGPFTFRQFVYLLIAAACFAAAWGFFQLFVPLALIPLPFAAFFLILALPLRKDQPMETYIAAIINFYLKPNHRIWNPGQRESTIQITAPKVQEKVRVRDLSEAEASSRLSFLADIVDTEGQAIRGNDPNSNFSNTSFKDEYVAEANQVRDILEEQNPVIDQMIQQEKNERHNEIVKEMRTAIERTENITTPEVQAGFQNLANNTDFSIQTIAQQANRLQQQLAPTPQPAPQPRPLYQPQYQTVHQGQMPQVQPMPPQTQMPPAQPMPAQSIPTQPAPQSTANLYQGPGPIFSS